MQFQTPFYLLPKHGAFIILILFSSCAATKFKVDKTPLARYFETNEIFRESHTGLMLYDVDEHSIIFDHNAQKHFIPASNTKLLTFYAATILMGDSIPSMNYCVVDDTLYFSGVGDPSFLYTNFAYSKTLNFLQSSPQALVYIEKPMKDQRFGPGWAWDDFSYNYSAEKSSFPIYGNTVQFQKTLDEQKVTVIPDIFEIQYFMKNDSSDHEFNPMRSEFENIFFINIPNPQSEIDEVVPFIYSRETFINLLEDTLKRTISTAALFPLDCRKQNLYSVPSDSISKHMLRESDNFLAEQMLLVISNQLGDTLSSDKTIDFIMHNNLEDLKEDLHWVDGSGLSRYNLVTPRAMTAVLEKIYQNVSKEKLYMLLPETVKNGKGKFSFPTLEGKFHAKTGSMSHVYNLSGFLETNSGKTLIFSFMNNNFNVSFSELTKEMERVLTVFLNDK